MPTFKLFPLLFGGESIVLEIVSLMYISIDSRQCLILSRIPSVSFTSPSCLHRYPNSQQYNVVVNALLQAYPFLDENGNGFVSIVKSTPS